MLKLVTIIILQVITVLAYSQTADTFKIFGIVVSANSGKPIPHASVMISKTKGYMSDSLGKFSIYGLTKGQHKLTFSAFGFENKDTSVNVSGIDIENFTWVIYTECWNYNREKALKDIQTKRPSILLQGGIAPIVYESDKEFETKYHVSFNDFGCVSGDWQECLVAYNTTIFDYLDKTYGKKWRKEIRKDVIGFKNK